MNSAEALRRVRLMQTHQELLWRPTPGFKEFSSDRHRWLLCRAANQCGKSMAAAHKIAMRMIKEPDLRARASCAQQGNEQAGSTALHAFISEALSQKDNYTEGRGFASNTISLRNGSILQFRSYEDHPQTGAGDQLHIVWLDEVPKPGHFREAIARVTRHSGQVICTLTPVDRPVAWFRDIIEPQTADGKRLAWIAGQKRPEGTQWRQYVVPFTRENVPWLSAKAYQQQIDLVSADPTQAEQRLREVPGQA